MSKVQEGAESILDHAGIDRPTMPTNLTFWQTCKENPWPASVASTVVLGLLLVVFWPKDKPTPQTTQPPAVTAAPTTQSTPEAIPEPAQAAETPSQPQATTKKIASKATKTPASSANLPAFDDASNDKLGDFIAELERKKTPLALKVNEPQPSASLLEQDFESRLFNFERKIP